MIPSVPEIMTLICKNIESIFFCFFGFKRMVDNSKKLRHEHEIEARACIIGHGFVFAASETVEPSNRIRVCNSLKLISTLSSDPFDSF
jgi:hypothetical protein